MLSRRKFIKLTSIAALSAASGFGFGEVLKSQYANYFALIGYLPNDKRLILKAVNLFFDSININSEFSIFPDIRKNRIVTEFSKVINFSSILKNISVTVRVKMLKHDVNADLLMSDSNKPIYSIEKDFKDELLLLRNSVNGLKASCLLIAEYIERNSISTLLNNRNKYVVIESEKGLIDKIPMDKNYNSILIKGRVGKTEFQINDGIVRVTKASCKHKLCKKTGLVFNNSDVIACAPNRVLIRIENS